MSMDTQENKTKFAEGLLLNPTKDAFDVASSLFPDVGMALQIASQWQRDPFVLGEIVRIKRERGARAFLADKDRQAEDIYRLINDPLTPRDEVTKLHRLYAEIMGHVVKPEASNTNVAVQVQHVMVVPAYDNDNDWERSALKQQAALTAHASDIGSA